MLYPYITSAENDAHDSLGYLVPNFAAKPRETRAYTLSSFARPFKSASRCRPFTCMPCKQRPHSWGRQTVDAACMGIARPDRVETVLHGAGVQQSYELVAWFSLGFVSCSVHYVHPWEMSSAIHLGCCNKISYPMQRLSRFTLVLC